MAVFTQQEQHPATDASASTAELQMDHAEHVMLHLDDELAGLIEAADMPADQHGTHTTKPEPASQVAGECIVPASALSVT